jgi:CheY-like chemotaxis protein/HPt (histidine-containing phosphotransfer) domain-containing protein
MGGEIAVRSMPGVGSTFWFTCRLAQPAADAAPPSSRVTPTISNRWRAAQRILIVDDLAANRAILQAELAALGLDSSSVDDPTISLDILRGAASHGCPFTCVLLDYRMPGMSGVELAQAISADPLVSGTPLILLASGFEDADRKAAQAAGIGAILDKPVRRAQLMQVLHRLASPEPVAVQAVQPHTPAPGARRRLKVLVVEDSPVNQRVATGLLEKVGYDAAVASNGRAGLDALDAGEYAAVLMDCLMPEMDGYTATVELRAREAAAGRARVPVIALTASARPEDRQRCLDSGMDDFLSKPIRGASLEAVLSRWTGDAAAAEDGSGESGDDAVAAVAAPERPAGPSEDVTLDLAALRPIQELEGLGRSGLFAEMLDLFRQEGTARVSDLRAALDRGDAERVYRLAHAMKGEALAWGATDLIGVSQMMEERARDGRLDDLAVPMERLAHLFEATLAALRAQCPRAA